MAGIVCRNICAECGLEVPRPRQITPLKIVENGQTEKLVMANRPDRVVLDKKEKEFEVIDVAIPIDSSNEETREDQEIPRTKRKAEIMWKMKRSLEDSVIPTERLVPANSRNYILSRKMWSKKLDRTPSSSGERLKL